jgi:DNA polymerase I-like protein with 3'-5' exonuclease and polymerase domains
MAAKAIKDIMENIVDFEVSLDVDLETGSNWGEMKKLVI